MMTAAATKENDVDTSHSNATTSNETMPSQQQQQQQQQQESVEQKARELYKGVALAPMVRASTTPLRILALKYGADFVYSEEFVDRSILDTIRVVNRDLNTIDYLRDVSKLSAKHQRKIAKCCSDDAAGPPLVLRIDFSLERGKFILQLGTGEPDLAVKAAMHVYKDVDAIDVNMGCPKKFSVSGGMGSALLSDPERAASIIRALRQALPTTPVSAKIRLLEDTQATVDFCQVLVDAGVNAIAIHGRRVGDESIHAAHWDELKETVKSLKTKHPLLPILVNGDFYTRAEWMHFMQDTGADGVLLARPALYNTSLFRKPTNLSLSSSIYGYNSPLLLEKTQVIQDYIRLSHYYNTHFKNTKYVICEMMQHRRTPTERVPLLPQTYPGQQTIGKTCACKNRDEICKLWNVNENKKEAAAAPAGEHCYEDSYFLKKDTTGTKNNGNGINNVNERDAKRPRVKQD